MTVPDLLAGALPHRRAQADLFAALLDGRRVNGGRTDHAELATLATLAQAMAPAQHAPDPAFRSALRGRLVAEAGTALPAVRPAQPGGTPAPQSTGTDAQRPPRWRGAVATLAVAALVSGVGAAAASSRALPGDALYGLKRQIEAVELSLARTDLDRGRELLEQAEARLTEAERLAASSTAGEPGTQDRLRSTLADMETVTAEGTEALIESYEETGDAEPLEVLQAFASEQRERLQDLMALLGPELRDELSAVLDELAALERRTSALLEQSAVVTALASARDSGDGWAVTRFLASSEPGAGPADTDLAATGADIAAGTAGAAATAGSDGARTADGGGVVGDLVDGVTDTLTGGSGGSTSGSTGGGSLGGGGVRSGDPTSVLDPVTEPLPLPSSQPLPTSTPLPTLDPTTITSPVPTVSVCVTVLGVETC